MNLEMTIAKAVSKDIKDVTDSRAQVCLFLFFCLHLVNSIYCSRLDHYMHRSQTALEMALAGDADEEIDTSIHSKRREYVPSGRTSSSRIRPKSALLKK